MEKCSEMHSVHWHSWFIAIHWNREFCMCCSAGNSLTICSCWPSVFFTNSDLVYISLLMVFPRPIRNTGISALFHMSRLVTVEWCKVFSPASGAFQADLRSAQTHYPFADKGLRSLAWQWIDLLLDHETAEIDAVENASVYIPQENWKTSVSLLLDPSMVL